MLRKMIKVVAIPFAVAGCATALAVAAYQDAPEPKAAPHNQDFGKAQAPGGMVPRPLPGPQPGGMMGGGMMGRGMMGGGMMNAMNAQAQAERTHEQEERDQERERKFRLEAVTKSVLLEKTDPNPLSKAVWKMLEQPVPMNFPNDTSLDDVLKHIQGAIKSSKSTGPNPRGLPIYVDPVGLIEADKSPQSTVNINLDGVPLKTTLRLILGQLELAYLVRDGVLVITSSESALIEVENALRVIEAEEEFAEAPAADHAKPGPL